MEDTPIRTPAGYAPAFAIGTRDAAGRFALIGDGAPLPVTSAPAPASDPLQGTSATAGIVGPFVPNSSAPIVVTLSGGWNGSVQLLRSTDGGATRHRVTVAGEPWGRFEGNICEPVWSETEAGVEFYLDIAPTSGTVEWRIAQ